MSHKEEKRLILVTGGAGYVGSNLIRDALASGYRVRCLDILVYGGKSLVGLLNHPDFQLIKGDVRDKKIVKRALKDVYAVIHLAAIVGDGPCQCAPRSAVQVNYHGTKNVADLAKEEGIERFVFASTCSTYGVIDASKPAAEDTKLNPVSLYAETKIDCEEYLKSITTDKFKPTSLRFGTAFGISFRTRFDLLVNSFVYEAMTDNKLVVFAANMWRPYIHVRDMGQLVLTILNTPLERVGGEIFNAGSTSLNYKKDEVIKMIQERIPSVEIHFANDIDDKRNYRIDFTKIETATNFKPTKTVESGIDELIKCFEMGILTSDDFESNNLDYLKTFFKEKEETIAN